MTGYTYGKTRPPVDIPTQLAALTHRAKLMQQAMTEQQERINQLEKRCTTLQHKLNAYANGLTTPTGRPTVPKGTRSYPATRARAHIKALNESGLTVREIAARAGVSPALIVGINTGKRPNVSPRSEALILALRPLRKRA